MLRWYVRSVRGFSPYATAWQATLTGGLEEPICQRTNTNLSELYPGTPEEKSVYYESRKWYECRCDERLKTESEKSTRLGYTGLVSCGFIRLLFSGWPRSFSPHGENDTWRKWKSPRSCFDKFVYYESRKRELKKRRKNEYRCDERLKTKAEESTYLGYTGLHEELKHLKIKTRLISANPVEKNPTVRCSYLCICIFSW